MIRLGVAEARRRLPELLARAHAGEVIVVDRHGRDVAALVPPAAARVLVDREVTVLPRIRRAARRLAAVESTVKQVVLFGSHARGDASPRSDVDLVVVLADALADTDFPGVYGRIEANLARALYPARADVVPVTESEWAGVDTEGTTVLANARREGVVVHGDYPGRRRKISATR